MNYLSEKKLHILFDAGIVIKAIDSIFEVALGITLLVVNPGTINHLFLSLFGDELTEQPRDAILQFISHGFHAITPDVQFVWALIFLAHGLAKIFLVAGLYKNKLWIYPVSAVIFACFAIYQIYHSITVPSVLMWTLTVFDIFFIALIVHEYHYQKKQNPE